jgi:hypothetical protein
MSIQRVSTSEYLTANREWLAALHGTDSTDAITLDLALFTEGVHYQCGDGCEPYGRNRAGPPSPRPGRSGRRGRRGAADGGERG